MKRRYCRRLTDLTLWAVEFDGPIALKAAGPLQPSELAGDINEQELPVDGKLIDLNPRYIVRLCVAEIDRIIKGIERRGVRIG